MTALTAVVRAPWAQSSVQTLYALPDPGRTAALARVCRETIDAVEDTFRLAWADARMSIEIDDAVRNVTRLLRRHAACGLSRAHVSARRDARVEEDRSRLGEGVLRYSIGWRE